MTIPINFHGLSLRAIKGNYFWSLEETQRASWLTDIAVEVPSDQEFEVHKWLNGPPSPEKWTGERKRSKFKDTGFTVVNDKYTNTIAVDVDKLRRDKTGQFLRRMREMGAKDAVMPQKLITTLLEAGASTTGYDGANFFADSHNHGGTCDNLRAPSATTPSAPTSAEAEAGIFDAIQGILATTDDQGEPANEFANRFVVMIPVGFIKSFKAALKNDFSSAGVSNTLPASGFTIDLVVNPRLSVATTFYTWRADAEIKPVIWQEENIGSESFKTLGMDSEGAFWKDELAVGTKRICQAALGRFELMSKSVFA